MSIAALAPLFQATEQAEKPSFVPDKKTVLQAAFKGLDHAQLTAFLVDRKQLQPNQSLFDISDEYAHRIALDPARFQRTVREFVEKDDPKTDDAEQTQTLQGRKSFATSEFQHLGNTPSWLDKATKLVS